MDIKEKLYIESLYDCYSSLLTEHQRDIFDLYYFEDLSLFEIAEIKNVSRNAVFILIHRIENTLRNYENKLHLKEKLDEIIKVLNDEKVEKTVVSKITSIVER